LFFDPFLFPFDFQCQFFFSFSCFSLFNFVPQGHFARFLFPAASPPIVLLFFLAVVLVLASALASAFYFLSPPLFLPVLSSSSIVRHHTQRKFFGSRLAEKQTYDATLVAFLFFGFRFLFFVQHVFFCVSK
jgi:hypothetical protein